MLEEKRNERLVQVLDSETETTKPPSAVNDFSIGSVVFEKYRILEFVAAGGCGRVYKAEDILRDSMVALKVLLGEGSKDQLMRFQKEAQTASRLNHPNIAKIYDFGLASGTPYLIMEFVDGETLEDLLTKTERLSLPTFCELFLQISRALAHAHENGVIHRDLKPANVIVHENSDGELVAKILDFGVAKLVSQDDVHLTPTGNIVGSPLYMSPEQARGNQVASQADLYSLGAMMFRSLAGKVPLKQETAIETIMLVSRTSAPLIESVVYPQVLPPDLCKLVNQLLSKSADDRPRLEAEVIPTLSQILQECSLDFDSESEVVAEETEATEKTDAVSLSNRSPKFVAAVVASAIGFLSIVFALSLLRTEQQEKKPEALVNTAGLSGIDVQIFPQADEVPNFKAKALPPPEEILPDKGRLNNSNLTDEQLASIPNPNSVSMITANDSKLLTLDSIGRFPKLTTLAAGGTHITDKAINNLSGLKNLRSLDVQSTDITDAALDVISTFKYLKYLDLSHNRLTPQGLCRLKSVPQLKIFKLRGTEFSKSDIEIFAPSISPECHLDLGVTRNLGEPHLRELSKKFPDVEFDYIPSTVFLVYRQSEAAFKQNPSLTNLLTIRHRLLEMLDELEHAYGKKTLRTRRTHIFLGNLEQKLGKPVNLKKAKEEFEIALEMSSKAGDYEMQMDALDHLVLLGFKTSGFEKTKALALHAIDLAETLHRPDLREYKCNRFLQMAQAAHSERQYATTLSIYEKALAAAPPEDPGMLGCIRQYRAHVLASMGKIPQAITENKRAVQIFAKVGANGSNQQNSYALAYGTLAHLYWCEKKEYLQALKFNDEYYRLAHAPGVELLRLKDSITQRIAFLEQLKRPPLEIRNLEKEREAVERKCIDAGGRK